MVRLREVPRTAAFAWSPGAASPLIATGTRAGAVDADFSNDTQLEIWDLALGGSEQKVELAPSGSISADSRFHDIAWGQSSDDRPRGIIAGALENGSLDLWDAEKLRTGDSGSFMSRTTKHSGAIKSLQFNPFRTELIATAGAKGELYIADLNNVANPFRLGTSAARADDLEAVDWNKKVPHILVTGSSGGFVTVWDVKAKKESLNLNNFGRKAVSAVAWDPDVPTRLITAIPNDQDPLILMWDLRNSNAPERTLKGHDQGVLSLSWCRQDSDILLSCGKDNRTICWNPHTGEALGDFPVVTNWTFQTRFNPHNPSLLATASFDGKIAVHTIQNTSAEKDQTSTATNQALDGEDFFARAQTQPQASTFSLPQSPKWLKRPVGVSFGFGGKIVKLAPGEAGSKQSKITISTFAVDSSIGEATESFEKTLKEGDISSICESKIAAAKSDEEKADWTVINTLISDNPRKKLVEYLGFDDAAIPAKDAKAEVQSNGANTKKDDASFFDEGGEGDSFLSELAATKGAKTNNPFQIFTGTEAEADKKITRALMLGQFENALDVCLAENRLSDAFMIAICGGQKCVDKAQAAYFRRRSDGPNYLRLLASVVGKNLWDVVYNADLSNWKEVMATLCTFADESEFPDLCEALGDRLEDSSSGNGDSASLRKDASFCYLAGSKLEKVVTNWVEQLQENEKAGLAESTDGTNFSVHARFLQDFIEKVTIFREVTGFKDSEQGLESGWKLAPLYAKYTEYADVTAAHGQLQVAEKYLDLLPQKYPAAEVAKNRVKQATRKAAPQAGQGRPAATATATATTSSTQRSQRVVPGYQQSMQTMPALQQQTASPYVPANIPTPGPVGTPYAPSGNAYTPSGYQPPAAQTSMGIGGVLQPGPYSGYQGGYQPPQPAAAIPPPPRNFTSSPATQATQSAGQKSNIPNWNDTPDFGLKPTSRRGTPSVVGPPVTAPYHGSSNYAPPGISPINQGPRATPPPPPKGPPRMSSPATGGIPAGAPVQERSSSAAASAYSPSQTQPSAAAPVAPPPLRSSSPFVSAPSGAPPSNRYAPAPGSQPTPPAGMAPPPRQVAPNPYAANSYATPSITPQPPPLGGTPPVPPHGAQRSVPPPGPPRAAPPPGGPPRAGLSGPPGGPPPGGPPPGGPSDSRPGTSQSASAPAPSRYPTGDRSHIPPNSQPIFDILNADFQRVKARAPANFRPQVMDVERRLDILFDHLNNEEVLKPDTVGEMNELAQQLQGRQYDQAVALCTEIMKNKNDEGSNWMVGVKRLIQMSRATPA